MRAEPLVRPDAPPVALRIDDVDISVPRGTTVLRAAELAGITIPSLCAHKELSPFGGCRLCAVQIEGMRGYPLACSTVATEGMVVTTETDELRDTRREVLRLILSQHPSSCLICDESESCGRSQQTIHKAGVATGCRSCTNDGDCELQDVVRLLGITEIGFPVTYRGLEPEHDDPFYDRDYNLCILCGRCVRMCQEVRGTAVLAFKYRGRSTLIGPSFGDSHVEAGCEFCGACVSVCPTGTLADKVSKWDGSPDGREVSTCPFCFLGCRLELAHVEGRLSRARGALDPEINDGQLCVRGAFCLPETTHHHDRLRTPMLRRGAYFRVATWDEALAEVGERLAAAPAGASAVTMLVSSDLSNEGLFAAQRFVREGLGPSAAIDSSVRSALAGGPAAWSRLFALPISLEAVSEADAVIVAGLDSRFSFSVVGVQVRRALRRGARVVAIDARQANLALMADDWLRPKAGEEARALTALLRTVSAPEAGGDARDLSGTGLGVRALHRTARSLAEAPRIAVVIDPRVFECLGAAEMIAAVETLADREGTTIVPLTHGTNVRGALEMGVLPELRPGPRWAADEETAATAASVLAGPGAAGTRADAKDGGSTAQEGRTPSILYLVGEAPFTRRPDYDYIIAQDLYPPPFEIDAFLPAASFVEAAGTVTNVEGRVQKLVQVERSDAAPDHTPRPDWRLFSDVARRLGRGDLTYADDAAVRDAIRAECPGFPRDGDRSPRRMRALERKGTEEETAVAGVEQARRSDGRPPGKGRFLLVQEHGGFRHRGIDMSGVVEGLGELRLEEGLRMGHEDMERLGIAAGDLVTVGVVGEATLTGDRVAMDVPVRPDQGCPRGAVYVTRIDAWAALQGREAVEPLRDVPPWPVRVRISPRRRAATGAGTANGLAVGGTTEPIAGADRGSSAKRSRQAAPSERG